MPCYNAQEVIVDVIKEWSHAANTCKGVLVVINDGSNDETLNIIKDNLHLFPNIYLINKKNSGHGSTCLQGYKWSIKERFEWIFQTDSDGQTNSKEFLNIWEYRKSHDFIFGFRKARGDGYIRLVISKILKIVIYIIFNTMVKDSNVPFRLMKSKPLSKILSRINYDLFLTNAYIAALINHDYKIKWVPITFKIRTGGIPSVKISQFFFVGIKVIKEFWFLKNNFRKKNNNS